MRNSTGRKAKGKDSTLRTIFEEFYLFIYLFIHSISSQVTGNHLNILATTLQEKNEVDDINFNNIFYLIQYVNIL